MKVVIIGGGMAGLVTAINISSNNDVTILEKNDICGKKILATGNGRCNYFNDDQTISKYHSDSNLDEIINKKNIDRVREFYKKIGIVPRIKNGYYYPYSNQALTVRDTLVSEAISNNVKIKYNTSVKDLEKVNDEFRIITNSEEITADIVVVATGGSSYKNTGSDGAFFSVLSKLHHNIVEINPSLIPLITKEDLNYIKGVRSDAKLTIYENDVKIKEEVGEIQFTSYGISGICVFNISRNISKYKENNYKVEINLVNNIANNKKELKEFLTSYKDRTISDILKRILNNKLVEFILHKSNINPSLKLDEIADESLDLLLYNIISFTVNISGTKELDDAQTISGGVSLTEINKNTFESLLVSNLYLTGEVLDVDGDCGGYNLTFACLSGIIVGSDINAKSTSSRN